MNSNIPENWLLQPIPGDSIDLDWLRATTNQHSTTVCPGLSCHASSQDNPFVDVCNETSVFSQYVRNDEETSTADQSTNAWKFNSSWSSYDPDSSEDEVELSTEDEDDFEKRETDASAESRYVEQRQFTFAESMGALEIFFRNSQQNPGVSTRGSFLKPAEPRDTIMTTNCIVTAPETQAILSEPMIPEGVYENIFRSKVSAENIPNALNTLSVVPCKRADEPTPNHFLRKWLKSQLKEYVAQRLPEYLQKCLDTVILRELNALDSDAPSVSPHEFDEWYQLAPAFEQMRGLNFINSNISDVCAELSLEMGVEIRSETVYTLMGYPLSFKISVRRKQAVIPPPPPMPEKKTECNLIKQ